MDFSFQRVLRLAFLFSACVLPALAGIEVATFGEAKDSFNAGRRTYRDADHEVCQTKLAIHSEEILRDVIGDLDAYVRSPQSGFSTTELHKDEVTAFIRELQDDLEQLDSLPACPEPLPYTPRTPPSPPAGDAPGTSSGTGSGGETNPPPEPPPEEDPPLIKADDPPPGKCHTKADDAYLAEVESYIGGQDLRLNKLKTEQLNWKTMRASDAENVENATHRTAHGDPIDNRNMYSDEEWADLEEARDSLARDDERLAELGKKIAAIEAVIEDARRKQEIVRKKPFCDDGHSSNTTGANPLGGILGHVTIGVGIGVGGGRDRDPHHHDDGDRHHDEPPPVDRNVDRPHD